MGVYPYITASIIIQLLTGVIPRLSELSKEGETGRNQLNKYTTWLTIPLAAFQAFGQAQLLSSQFGALPLFRRRLPADLTVIVSLVAGTMFLVWLGELITENGIGQGISIIIFGGIVSRIPGQILQLGRREPQARAYSAWRSCRNLGSDSRGYHPHQRRPAPNPCSLLAQYHARWPNDAAGRSVFHTFARQLVRYDPAHLCPLDHELPSNRGRLLHRCQQRSGVRDAALWIYGNFQPSTFQYNMIYFVMVVVFTFFYTSVVFSQQRIAENLQKSGGAVPGIRPGPNTDRFLTTVLTRITVGGAVFLGMVAILPWIASQLTGVQQLNFSSTSLLILVGVAIDTMKQLESQLLMRRYEGFINR